MKTLIYCLALVAMAGFTSAAFAQEPTLTSVEAKFDTTTDNKKQRHQTGCLPQEQRRAGSWQIRRQ